MVQPARYLVSAEVKVAARRIVSDGCEAMNRPTPLQGSVINAPHSSETDLDATRYRIRPSACPQKGVRSPWWVSTSVACSIALIASAHPHWGRRSNPPPEPLFCLVQARFGLIALGRIGGCAEQVIPGAQGSAVLRDMTSHSK